MMNDGSTIRLDHSLELSYQAEGASGATIGQSSRVIKGGQKEQRLAASIDELLASALERGDDSLVTGRFIVTLKEGALEEAITWLRVRGFRVADARDFQDQSVSFERLGDADALVLAEIGAVVVGGETLLQRGVHVESDVPFDSPIEVIEPEYFAFAAADNPGYLRGLVRAAESIALDLRADTQTEVDYELDLGVAAATWGLIACKVPGSLHHGLGIKVAVLDTGFDVGTRTSLAAQCRRRHSSVNQFRISTATALIALARPAARRRPPGIPLGTASVTERRSSRERRSRTLAVEARPQCSPG